MTGARCLVLGGGGHARVVIDTVRLAGVAEPVGILDIDVELRGTAIDGVPVIGTDEELEGLSSNATCFVVGVGGAGDNSIRERLFTRGLESGLDPLVVVHPSASISRRARLDQGVFVGAGAIVNVGAVIAKNVLLNSACVIEHDCIIGEHTHIASGAVIAGNCHVGASVHVGAGAVLKQGLRIGDSAVVGAGAAVISDVSQGSVVVGVPARPITTDAEPSPG